MYRYCFNSTTLRDMDLFSALGEIKAHGYDAVELSLNDTHVHPLKTPAARVREVRDFCTGEDIAIACVAAGGDTLLSDIRYEPSLICADADGRARRVDLLRRAIDIALTLDAPVVNFNSGLLNANVDRSQARHHLLAGVEALLNHADGVILVIEPEPDFFIGSTVTAMELISEIDNPRLRLNLDIGHVFCSEPDPYNAIEAALRFARHIHIEDIKNRIHHHEIPGEGDIDFSRILALLTDAGYQHFVSVELHHHNDRWRRALAESLAYLRAIDAAAFPAR